MAEEQLPVLASEARPVDPARGGGELAIRVSPAAQAAVVTAASAVAGAAVVLAAKHHKRASLARRRRKARRHGGELVQVLATRSFLVDVSLVDKG